MEKIGRQLAFSGYAMNRKQQAYDFLKKAIITNAIPAGEPVREKNLAEELNMSRTPIREAMRELETEGILMSFPGRGTFVVPITPSDVEEIYELRSMHELWAIERSFDRITREELEFVEKAFEASYQAANWQAWHHADRLLHRLILEKSGNKRLIVFMSTLNTQLDRIRGVSAARDTARFDVSYREHKQIIEHLRARNLPKCKEALRYHLRSVANSAIEASKNTHIDLERAMMWQPDEGLAKE